MSDPSRPPHDVDQTEAGPTRQTGPEQHGTPADVPVSGPLTPPTPFGRYRVERLLGRGGMGSVYLATDPQLDRAVALKIPHLHAEQRAEGMKRFLQEARSAARLHHAHICPVYDVGEVDGIPYLTMAYIDGEALSASVADFARRPPRQAVALALKIAQALTEAHRLGVIHRDLKPSNVMISRRGEPMLMDFGLAKQLRPIQATASQQQTLPGVIMGTPAYMSPEQAQGATSQMGPGCDVYSLGVLLYELLTGRTPFVGDSLAMLYAHVHETPTPPSRYRPEVDAVLDRLCLRALAKRADHRFPTMADLAKELEDYLAPGRPTPSVSPAIPLTEPQSFEGHALQLLRTWGWEGGMERLRQHAETLDGNERPAHVELLLRWLGGESMARAEAARVLASVPHYGALRGWSLLGQVVTMYRQHDLSREHALLDQALVEADPADNVLQATIIHLRATLLYRRGRLAEAVKQLHDALTLLGKDHFLTGRLLDTLGMIYAGLNNFHSAREFFQQGLLSKDHYQDEAGIALAHGQLGRLYLDWGWLDKAEEHFYADFKLVRKLQDDRGQALMANQLGRVETARGEQEAAAGRPHEARRHWRKAAEWLDSGLRRNEETNRRIMLAHSYKDRALLHLLEGQLDQAETYLNQARQLFDERRFLEGLAHVDRAVGVLARRRGQFAESQRLLQDALAFLDSSNEYAEAARTQLEVARTLRAAGDPSRLVTEAYLDALDRAERCRRPQLVQTIEQELRGLDEEAHWHHVYQRVRGRSAPLDTTSLFAGNSEVATALFLNLVEFIPYCQGLDPEEALLTLNQLMAEFSEVLDGHAAHVTAHLGGGFMALLRERNHAVRAVNAALELLEVIGEYNRPRAVLGMRLLPVRVGIATGSMFMGNVGTYRKMDFTAIGTAVNLASRLMREAAPSSPCISQATYDLVRDQFQFRSDNPRCVELRGIGRREVWDVVGRPSEKGATSRR